MDIGRRDGTNATVRLASASLPGIERGERSRLATLEYKQTREAQQVLSIQLDIRLELVQEACVNAGLAEDGLPHNLVPLGRLELNGEQPRKQVSDPV